MTKRILHIVLDSRLDELDRLAAAIERFCSQAGQEAAASAYTLCAEELITNVILHGFCGEAGHAIDVKLAEAGGAMSIEIVDDAAPFDPTAPVRPDLTAGIEDREIGGLGRHLVSTLMDRFCYSRLGNRNHVVFGRAARQESDAWR